MDALKQGLLSLLVFLPLVGAAGVTLLGLSGRTRLLKPFAVGWSLVPFLLSLYLWHLRVTSSGVWTAEVNFDWIPILLSRYHMGADGISVSLAVLSTLLTTLSLVFAGRLSESKPEDRLWQYYGLFFLLEVGMLGVFLSLDLVLFFLFWEISLIPMYFIILLWGGPQREAAALKFILYTILGSAGLLVAFAAVYLKSHTTDIVALMEIARHQPLLSGVLGMWVFWALWVGFAIKVPVFPFHTWLPLAHVEAPTEGSVILAAILLKMGVYGMIRICLQVLPQQFHYFSSAVAWLGAISVIYGALCAMGQTDLKKLVAYSSINHMGFCVMGVAAAAGFSRPTTAATTALNGSVMEMLAHGIITGAMFMLVGVIYERAHHRDLDRFGGLWSVLPVYGGIMIFCTLASLGLPLLMGFVGELLVFLGAYPVFPGAVIFATFGLILAAAYWLWMLQRLLYGPLRPEYEGLPEVNRREGWAVIPLMVCMVVFGVFPRLILDMVNTASVYALGTVPGDEGAAAAPTRLQPQQGIGAALLDKNLHDRSAAG